MSMGIYIKGMEMPKNDEMLHIKIYPNGKVAIDMDLECKQIATAAPVPPHGRLIDADALIYALETQDYSCAPDTLDEWTPMDMTRAEIYDIKAAPTIIPAEEGE